MSNQKYVCPECSSINLTAKYESAYVYSYKIDQAHLQESEDYVAPFLFEDRQLKYAKEYVVCNDCNCTYPLGSDIK